MSLQEDLDQAVGDFFNQIQARKAVQDQPSPVIPAVTRTVTQLEAPKHEEPKQPSDVDVGVFGAGGSGSGGDGTPLTADDFTEIYVTGNVAAAPAFVYLAAFTATNTDWQML